MYHRGIHSLMLCILLLMPIFAIAQDNTNTMAAVPFDEFQEGKQYLKIPGTDDQPPANGRVKVVEFFSFGCPACYRLEPVLEAWIDNKPAYVDFSRVPVVFHPEWEFYAKTYYATVAMKIADKMTPHIFQAIQRDGRDLSNEQAMAKFFGENKLNPNYFISVFNFSPGINAQLAQGDAIINAKLMNKGLIKKDDWVPQIPTILIDDKYITSAGLTNGDYDAMVRVVDFLIQKEHPSGLPPI
jgi:protein dithiol oxidoreductase (disulfide-forming)